MFHVPAHKVPAGQPQPGQSYFDPRLALVEVRTPRYIGRSVIEISSMAAVAKLAA